MTGAALTYPEVGATAGPDELPRATTTCTGRSLGEGDAVFAAAAEGVRTWALHRGQGFRVLPAGAAVAEGTEVLVDVPLVPGVHVIATCRVVWAVDGPDRVGFGYGTCRSTRPAARRRSWWSGTPAGTVRIDVRAFSRPRHPLMRLGGPVARHQQARANRGYADALARHVRSQVGAGADRPAVLPARSTAAAGEPSAPLAGASYRRPECGTHGGKVTAEQAVAYRVAAHHLHERLPVGGSARGGRGGRRPGHPAGHGRAGPGRPRGQAHPRRRRRRPPRRPVAAASRGPARRPHLVPRCDAGVFGPGGLAADEESLREQLGSAWTAIDAPGWTAREALGAVIGVLAAVLADAEPRTKGELSEALHGRVPPELEPWCDVCDVHHVPEQLLRLAGMAGTFCYGWPQGTRQMLMATDIWLGEPLGGDVRSGRVELARRFVHAYGPVAPATSPPGPASAPPRPGDRFLDLGDELVEVRLDGAPGWVLAADLDELRDPPLAGGPGCCRPATPSSLSGTARR